jgi:hypothetical protein
MIYLMIERLTHRQLTISTNETIIRWGIDEVDEIKKGLNIQAIETGVTIF